ncbi:MAG: cobalamin-dependent protein, partial [Desulfamplus sp.]|nr:cobalamin-dependent protein [Desulfamplus sp.]
MFAGKSFSRYGIEPEWFKQDLKRVQKEKKPDLIFVTSIMTYWASGVKETISVIKEIFQDVPVILGGIYATLCTEHARNYSMADEVITGAGEEQIFDIIKRYTSFSLSNNFLQPINSKSLIDSNSLASIATNYSNISFDHSTSSCKGENLSTNLDLLPYPALDLISNLTYAPILTSRGCPFSCTYCASSFLEPKMRRRSPDSVFEEICHWYENYGVHNFAFYDDALLINPDNYILPLLEKILIYSQSIPSTPSTISTASFNSKDFLSIKSSSSPIAPLPTLSFHTPNALHIRQ